MKLLALPFKILVWLSMPVVIAAGLLLFGPGPLIKEMGLAGFMEEYRPLIGTSFVVGYALWLTGLIWFIFSFFAKHIMKRNRKRRKCLEQLEGLSGEQRGYLLEFVQGQRVIEYMLVDTIAGGLRQKDILYINVRNIGMVSAPHRIRPKVLRLLKRRPHLLEGAVIRDSHPLQKTRS